MRKALLWVALAGAVGGLANALLAGGGLALPEIVRVEGSPVFVPGFFGNVFIGAIAAVLSWGLYGPFAHVSLLGGSRTGDGSPPEMITLPLAALAGALLVGFSGGRWMTAEAEKQLNHGTAVLAAEAAERAARSSARGTPSGNGNAMPPAPALPEVIRNDSPLRAYRAAQRWSAGEPAGP